MCVCDDGLCSDTVIKWAFLLRVVAKVRTSKKNCNNEKNVPHSESLTWYHGTTALWFLFSIQEVLKVHTPCVGGRSFRSPHLLNEISLLSGISEFLDIPIPISSSDKNVLLVRTLPYRHIDDFH